MFVTVLGSVTVLRLWQFANALAPMLVTLLGIVIVVKPKQL